MACQYSIVRILEIGFSSRQGILVGRLSILGGWSEFRKVVGFTLPHHHGDSLLCASFTIALGLGFFLGLRVIESLIGTQGVCYPMSQSRSRRQFRPHCSHSPKSGALITLLPQ